MAWGSFMRIRSLVLLLLWGPSMCWSQKYEDVMALYRDKFNSDVYNADVVPRNNQSEMLYIGVLFQLVSIINVDDVYQSFTTNAFLTLYWTDERLTWDPRSYGQLLSIYPPMASIWRPHMALVNTVQQRDIFQDYKAPLILSFTGTTFWSPGALFPVSCALDLTKYPFDEQTCDIWFVPMNNERQIIEFYALENFDAALTDFFIRNGEWELVGSKIATAGVSTQALQIPDIKISLIIRRRPTTLVLNIILPVVCLSLLNILVFAIPVESGEKISYGITVLLALSVFLSIVGSMLPRSADNLPYVTIYLSSQLVTSVINVILSIVVVFLHHRDGDDDISSNIHHDSKTTSQGRKNKGLLGASQSVSTQQVTFLSDLSVDSDTGLDTDVNVNEVKAETKHAQVHSYRRIGKYLNATAFVSALVLWAAMTAAFFIIVAT